MRPFLAVCLALVTTSCMTSRGSDFGDDAAEGDVEAANGHDAVADLVVQPDVAAPRVCVPGAQVACACVGGAAGAQVCTSDGTALGPCMCPGAGEIDAAVPADAGLDVGSMDAGRADAGTLLPPLDVGWPDVVVDNGAVDRGGPFDTGVIVTDRGGPVACPSSCGSDIDCNPCRTSSDPATVRYCCLSGLCISMTGVCPSGMMTPGGSDGGAGADR